jgi:hypothetical protein
LPNIKQMIERVGRRKPKYFGNMDLTAGYHQFGLAKDARVFTAFICFLGIFQWCRVPMGLKGAGSFFQRQMAMNVLVGLVSIVCELYLDDVLVYGETETEFLKNLRTVFVRFRKHKILLKPKKCAFGMNKIEFVGHTISEEGVSFSREKLQEVLDFPRPVKQQQLRFSQLLQGPRKEPFRQSTSFDTTIQRLR